MAVLYQGELDVHYGFGFLRPPSDSEFDGFGHDGQLNGLCGATIPGALSFMFGLHTGRVPLVIEALDRPPSLDEDWEEAVEVSLTAMSAEYVVEGFDDWHDVPLPSVGVYRVRFLASGMDAAREADCRMDDEPALDRYLVQLWPDDTIKPDEILKVTSETALYWHRVAQGLEK